jgi:mannosyltransferase OCH1-like enzyme
MRFRIISAVCLVAALVLLRHHIRDLWEVARTYATFYKYLRSHPTTLLKYPDANERHGLPQNATLVPQILHQVFLTDGRAVSPTKHDAARSSCRELHPNWTYSLWEDSSAMDFISQHYPNLLPHYQGYKQSIQRANILRYALLDHAGGVYLDLDITCRQSLDNLRQLPFLTPGAYPAGVNNAFILSRPRHPFLQHLLDGVESRDLGWGMPYIENMLSTGCMFFSNRWMSYVRSLGQTVRQEDGVYILADEEGDPEPHMLRGAVTTPLFEHDGASSWHG